MGNWRLQYKEMETFKIKKHRRKEYTKDLQELKGTVKKCNKKVHKELNK